MDFSSLKLELPQHKMTVDIPGQGSLDLFYRPLLIDEAWSLQQKKDDGLGVEDLLVYVAACTQDAKGAQLSKEQWRRLCTLAPDLIDRVFSAICESTGDLADAKKG